MKARRLLGAALLGACALTGAFAVQAVIRHEQARVEYEEGLRASYQGEASDARYGTVLRARDDAEAPSVLCGGLLAWGLALLGSSRHRSGAGPAIRRGVLGADVGLLLLAITLATLAPGWLGARHEALGVLLGPALLGLGLGTAIGLLAGGRSLLGVLLARENGRSPGVGLAMAMLVLALLTLPWTLASRTPPALRWTGLRWTQEPRPR